MSPRGGRRGRRRPRRRSGRARLLRTDVQLHLVLAAVAEDRLAHHFRDEVEAVLVEVDRLARPRRVLLEPADHRFPLVGLVLEELARLRRFLLLAEVALLVGQHVVLAGELARAVAAVEEQRLRVDVLVPAQQERRRQFVLADVALKRRPLLLGQVGIVGAGHRLRLDRAQQVGERAREVARVERVALEVAQRDDVLDREARLRPLGLQEVLGARAHLAALQLVPVDRVLARELGAAVSARELLAVVDLAMAHQVDAALEVLVAQAALEQPADRLVAAVPVRVGVLVGGRLTLQRPVRLLDDDRLFVLLRDVVVQEVVRLEALVTVLALERLERAVLDLKRGMADADVAQPVLGPLEPDPAHVALVGAVARVCDHVSVEVRLSLVRFVAPLAAELLAAQLDDEARVGRTVEQVRLIVVLRLFLDADSKVSVHSAEKIEHKHGLGLGCRPKSLCFQLFTR